MEDVSSKWKVKIYWLNLSAYCQPTCTAVTDRTNMFEFFYYNHIYIYMFVGSVLVKPLTLVRWSWSYDRVYIINDKKIEEARSSIYVTTYVQRYSMKIQAICPTHKLYIISDRSDPGHQLTPICMCKFLTQSTTCSNRFLFLVYFPYFGLIVLAF